MQKEKWMFHTDCVQAYCNIPIDVERTASISYPCLNINSTPQKAWVFYTQGIRSSSIQFWLEEDRNTDLEQEQKIRRILLDSERLRNSHRIR